MYVLATAGHVDHGKSTLVRALTGMEPDRWAEERRRGLTIDLGYAWTTLPTGEQLAFVDVPGHERFIANMLAGIGPAPGVLFVVAADGGWSRQSDEHLAAVNALDLQHGMLAVTRSDLADPTATMRESLDRIRAIQPGRRRSRCSVRRDRRRARRAARRAGRARRHAAGSRPGRAGALVDRPGLRRARQRHRCHRHARSRVGCRRRSTRTRRARGDACAACRAWANRSRSSPELHGSRSTCAASLPLTCVVATSCSHRSTGTARRASTYGSTTRRGCRPD